MIISFGKYKGFHIKDIPTEYLEWGANKLEGPKKKQFQNELQRRRDEAKIKEQKIIDNIDSPETWDLIVKEVESELWGFDPENGYDLTHDQIIKLARERLIRYKKKIELNNLDNEFVQKWNLSQKQLDLIHSEFQLNRKNFSTEEKYLAAVEYMEKRNDLIWVLSGL